MKIGKSLLSWGSLSLLLITFWLLALAPAELVYRLMPAQLKAQAPIKVKQLQGTLWKGKATSPRISGLQLDLLEWQVSPFSLMTLQPGGSFRGEGLGSTLEGDALFADEYVQLSDIRGSGDLSALLSAASPWLARGTRSTWGAQLIGGVDGQVSLDLEVAKLNKAGCELFEGELALQEVAIPFWAGNLDLEAELSCQGKAIVAQVTDTGDLALQATLRIQPDGGYQLTGSLEPKSREQVELLRLTGIRERNGRFMFEI